MCGTGVGVDGVLGSVAAAKLTRRWSEPGRARLGLLAPTTMWLSALSCSSAGVCAWLGFPIDAPSLVLGMHIGALGAVVGVVLCMVRAPASFSLPRRTMMVLVASMLLLPWWMREPEKDRPMSTPTHAFAAKELKQLRQMRVGLATATVPYQPGPSICDRTPGFVPLDVYPIRAPLLVVDYLLELANAHGHASGVSNGRTYKHRKNLTLVEVGSRQGDVLACIAQHLGHTRVSSIELVQSYCDTLRSRGLLVTCERFSNSTPHVLPSALLYYFWMPVSGSLDLARIVDVVLRGRGESAVLAMAYDLSESYDEVLPSMARDLLTLRGPHGHISAMCRPHVQRIHFDEELHPHPKGFPAVGARRPRGWEASWGAPYANRYGHFGVFHLVSLRVGKDCHAF